MNDGHARRSAIITGGSKGIGLGVAHYLVSRGWSLTITARHVDQLADAAEELQGREGQVQTLAGDVADEATTTALLQMHEASFGGLSALVLAAGVGSAGRILGYSMNRVDKQLAVNFRAPFDLVARALPLLRRSAAENGLARIVALASIEGVHPGSGLAVYAASKAALISLVDSINIEENANGVLATAISPAFVATGLSAWTTDTVPFETMISVSDVVSVVDAVLSLSPNANIRNVVINRVGAGPYHA